MSGHGGWAAAFPILGSHFLQPYLPGCRVTQSAPTLASVILNVYVFEESVHAAGAGRL